MLCSEAVRMELAVMEMGSPLPTPSHAFCSNSGARFLQAVGRPASWGVGFLFRGPPPSASQRSLRPPLTRHSSQLWVMLFITQCGISNINRWFPNSCVPIYVFEVTLHYCVAGTWGSRNGEEGEILGQIDVEVKSVLWAL